MLLDHNNGFWTFSTMYNNNRKHTTRRYAWYVYFVSSFVFATMLWWSLPCIIIIIKPIVRHTQATTFMFSNGVRRRTFSDTLANDLETHAMWRRFVRKRSKRSAPRERKKKGITCTRGPFPSLFRRHTHEMTMAMAATLVVCVYIVAWHTITTHILSLKKVGTHVHAYGWVFICTDKIIFTIIRAVC